MSGATRLRIPAAIAAVGVATAIVVAGCSSGEGGRAGPATGPTAVPAATDPPTSAASAPTGTAAGPRVAVPETFPSAVPLPEGIRLTKASEIAATQSLIPGWILTFEARGPASGVVEAYADRLSAAGFRVAGRGSTGKPRSKGKRTLILATSSDWTVTFLGGDVGVGSATLLLSVSPRPAQARK